jgi:glyoxylase-like metal-dependent hydrolase (beta-lactamase superfamily II)
MTTNDDGVHPVGPAVLRITRAATNCYLLDTADGPVLIDAGLPRAWPLLVRALETVGLSPDDLVSVYLTHGHFDHVGMCDRLVREHHVPLHVHDDDVALVRHPYRYAHERPRWRYPIRFPAAIPALARMTAAGALSVHGVDAHGDVRPGARLLGGLVPIATPGHTRGHCAFFWPEQGVLFSGDALVTFDPYTAAAGPRVVARAATADASTALRALDALAATRARLGLPGHGRPFEEGAEAAAAAARRTPVA